MSTRPTHLIDVQQERLRDDVERIAGDLGERNAARYARLLTAATLIEEYFREAGCRPARQRFEAYGLQYANIEVELRGAHNPEEIVLVGAHYDSARGSPGAEDNASGVAALLALAREFAGRRISRTLRLAAFTNEHVPFRGTPDSGSVVYARSCRAACDRVRGMLALDCLGCRRAEPGSQRLSLGGLLLPRCGDFITFVANRESRDLQRRAVVAFRARTGVPAVGKRAPGWFSGPQRAFWKQHYPAVLVTDTAHLRYRATRDVPAELDFRFLHEVVEGLKASLETLLME